jgi:hypothetical protein
MIIIGVVKTTPQGGNMLVYSKPKYVPQSRATNWYDYYERSAICAQCGEELGTQSSTKGDRFYFYDSEKAKYKFCPYCGQPLYKEEK